MEFVVVCALHFDELLFQNYLIYKFTSAKTPKQQYNNTRECLIRSNTENKTLHNN